MRHLSKVGLLSTFLALAFTSSAMAATGTWKYAIALTPEPSSSFNINVYNISGSTQTVTYTVAGSVTETGTLSNIADGSAVGQSYSCPAGFCIIRIQITTSNSLVAPRVTFTPEDATQPFIITPGDFQVVGPAGTITNAAADTQTAIASLTSQVTALQTSVSALQTSVNQSSICKRRKNGNLLCTKKN